MNIIFDRDQFLEPLNRVSTVVEKNPALPILSQVLLQTEDEGIRLTGSNIQMEISELIPDVRVPEKYAFTFACRTVLGFCRRLPPRCRLRIEIAQDMMTITKVQSVESEDGIADHAEYFSHSQLKTEIQDQLQENMPGLESQLGEFPILEPGEMSVQFDMLRSDLHSLIRRTQHAMGSDDSRYFLNATLFEISQKDVRTVTTDAHRMATSLTEVQTNLDSERHRSIVPRQTVLDMNKLLAEISSKITVEFNNRHVRLKTPDFSFTSKLLEGSYPDWRGAIPVNLPHVLRVKRDKLVEVLKIVNGTFPDEKSPLAVRLELEESTLQVHAESKLQGENFIDLELEIEEPTEYLLRIKANCAYLQDVLEAMSECESVDFYNKDNQGACIIRFPDDESATFVVMLLRNR